ncbi:MAG: indole-3-glycerol phosphate synthase TrpC [Dehalococcoidales bacterium]|nr:indole-3-glycerol phosphate synthase TrpC [Dehalococcoidales bacterium]
MILERIITDTRTELERRKKTVALAELEKRIKTQSPPRDLAAALKGDRIRLIAEVKKASPSRGVIRADFRPVEIAQTYTESGAAAISVLTETRYFQGSLDYLRDIGKVLDENRIPLLRKDFIIDPYQVYESRAYGADSLLLIVAILTPAKLKELLNLSHELGMGCLVEVHDEKEAAIALASDARIIGINNRNLKTFKVDINTTQRLRLLIPPGRTVVSESGIKERSHLLMLKDWGVDAVLIGEAFMAAPDIAAKMKEFLP